MVAKVFGMKMGPYVDMERLTRTNIRMLNDCLRLVLPVPHDHRFDDLLSDLDRADEAHH